MTPLLRLILFTVVAATLTAADRTPVFPAALPALATTSSSKTASRFRCATASSSTPTSIDPSETNPIPSSSPVRPTALNAPRLPTGQRFTSPAAAMPTFSKTSGDDTSRKACGTPHATSSKTATTPSSGPAYKPWSNGKVGMQGGSYLGSDQWQAAKLQPPHLVSIFPDVPATSWYHHAFTLNGGFRLSLAFGWGPVRQESQIMQNTGQHTMEGGPENISYDKVLWHLPLSEMQQLLGRNAKFYDDWLAHPDYDDYWKAVSVEEHFDKMQVPAYSFGGWFDILLQGTLNGYTLLRTQGGTPEARRGRAPPSRRLGTRPVPRTRRPRLRPDGQRG